MLCMSIIHDIYSLVESVKITGIRENLFFIPSVCVKSFENSKSVNSKLVSCSIMLLRERIILIVADGFEPLVAFLLVVYEHNVREVLEP